MENQNVIKCLALETFIIEGKPEFVKDSEYFVDKSLAAELINRGILKEVSEKSSSKKLSSNK